MRVGRVHCLQSPAVNNRSARAAFRFRGGRHSATARSWNALRCEGAPQDTPCPAIAGHRGMSPVTSHRWDGAPRLKQGAMYLHLRPLVLDIGEQLLICFWLAQYL
jgi:hypothetical protein